MKAVDGVASRSARGEDPRPRRRIRLGQVDDRLLDHGADRSARPDRRGPHPLQGRDLARADAERLRSLRGNRIAMIFQDPMMTLNPVLRIDTQMVEAILAHEQRARRASARALRATRWRRSASPSPTSG